MCPSRRSRCGEDKSRMPSLPASRKLRQPPDPCSASPRTSFPCRWTRWMWRASRPSPGRRPDLDGERVGMLGVSLGGYYAARAAAFEPRIRAVVVSGGPYDYGALIRDRPAHSLATFAHNSGTTSTEETYEFASRITLEGVLGRLTQPMVVVFGKRDRLVPWQQAVRVAHEAPHADLWM